MPYFEYFKDETEKVVVIGKLRPQASFVCCSLIIANSTSDLGRMLNTFTRKNSSMFGPFLLQNNTSSAAGAIQSVVAVNAGVMSESHLSICLPITLIYN